MKLYELTEQYQQVQNLEDLPEEALADTLEGIEGEIADKAEGIMMAVQNLNAEIEALRAHKKAIDARISARVNRAEAIKDYLRHNMEASGIKQITCPLFTINCVQGREIAEVEDINKLKGGYVTVKVTQAANKAKILEDLKAGTDVKGAKLARAKSSIRIK